MIILDLSFISCTTQVVTVIVVKQFPVPGRKQKLDATFAAGDAPSQPVAMVTEEKPPVSKETKPSKGKQSKAGDADKKQDIGIYV